MDTTELLREARPPASNQRGLSSIARSLRISDIMRIAYEIRAAGNGVLDLTVGDFSPDQFPIPDALHDSILGALADGRTNYPTVGGVRECREAVQAMFEERLGLRYPYESVSISGGARPMLAATFMALVDPGEHVVYSVPSWNNDTYCALSSARNIELTTNAASNFMLRAVDLEPHLEEARIVCINTPQNPTGTVIEASELAKISKLIVEENERRKSLGRRALYLMFDQVYWMLTFGDAHHHTPVQLVPEIAPFTIIVDGITKAFAATGLRVGWAVGPPDVIAKMVAYVGHLGAWAPHLEQVAVARFLPNRPAVDAHLLQMRSEVLARLELLSRGVERSRAGGHPVEAISPQGAIYLSMRIDIRGKRTPDGKLIQSGEDVRKYLLDRASIGLIPFNCFGVKEDSAWFRASIGVVSKADCEAIGPRLQKALDELV